MATNDIRDTLSGAAPQHLLYFPRALLLMDTTVEYICDYTTPTPIPRTNAELPTLSPAHCAFSELRTELRRTKARQGTPPRGHDC
ncbi:hypothetical protein AZE42_12312 [Rhizopogon vesiculosus]|uniref:Uncharacterized protein n=1 Tax=Rhizopogon vesiculosus TaxID=180088 RepID=A0A1J8QHY5_9AGAM|nr:hypothetical protein AZE42_12312 [Rhizopogon vesiculosus]